MQRGDLIIWRPIYKTSTVNRDYYIGIVIKKILYYPHKTLGDLEVMWEGKICQWNSLNCEVINSLNRLKLRVD